jgi:hypothetical protein
VESRLKILRSGARQHVQLRVGVPPLHERIAWPMNTHGVVETVS